MTSENSVTDVSDRLSSLLRLTKASNSWKERTKIDDYCKSILICLLSRCGPLSAGQIGLVKECFGAGDDLTEPGYRAWIPSEANGALQAVNCVPKFFKVFATNDVEHDTRITSKALSFLHHFIHKVIFRDTAPSDSAAAQASAIINVLTRYLDNRMVLWQIGEDAGASQDKPASAKTPETTKPVSLLNVLSLIIALVEKTPWRSVYADEDERNVDVFNYGKLLLCFLIASDQRLSEQEAQLLQTFWLEATGSSLSGQQVSDLVVSSQDEAVSVLSAPPAFFRLLVAHDLQNRTDFARGAFQLLQIFVQAAVAVDGEVTDAEAETAARVLANLSACAEWQGLKLELLGQDSAVKTAEPVETRTNDSLSDLLKQLTALVGLSQVKEEVNGLVNLIKVRKLRQDRGIKCPPLSLHLVFSGNPGTGKTTVARLLGSIFKALGLLSKGHLVEVDRSGLVAGYVGQTAIKVNEVTDKSLGGILFIDEAYSLASKGEQDFGREAVETLLKTMEDHRGDLVVIAAGYTDKMEEFLNINPGLRSRFNKFIQFQDYSPDELLQICCQMCRDNGYEFTTEFRDKMREILAIEFNLRGKDFANARTARNFFERAVATHSNRLAAMESPSDKDLVTFQIEDLAALAKRER